MTTNPPEAIERIRRSIAGDLQAAARYRAAGDEARACESEASAHDWLGELDGAEVRYHWPSGYEEDGDLPMFEAIAVNIDDEYVVESLLGLRAVGDEYTIGGGAAPELTVRRIR